MSAPASTGCTDPAHRLLHVAPVPCSGCRGWLDRDGSVMSREETIRRYPFMRDLIASEPAELLPDYVPQPPSTGERFLYGVRLAGALSRALLAVIFAALAIVVVVLITLALVH